MVRRSVKFWVFCTLLSPTGTCDPYETVTVTRPPYKTVTVTRPCDTVTRKTGTGVGAVPKLTFGVLVLCLLKLLLAELVCLLSSYWLDLKWHGVSWSWARWMLKYYADLYSRCHSRLKEKV